METLKCFKCNIEKPLSKFKDNNRTYQLKSSKGKCIVCKLCSLQGALESLSVVRFDYEQNKFVCIKFETQCEVLEFYQKEGGEL